jgi:UDP-N-acetylglucosamine 2-epimerase (non-hydrolysing)
MKIISVVGARPNFMKIAPFAHAIIEHNKTSHDLIDHIIVHTGQHYDDRMSRVFFESLDIPEAQINLGIGSGSHAEQVGQTMIAFEKVLLEHQPDWVVVLGDVNATLACSVTAKKLNIKVCHIEAGLRSGDITMPEEVNRLVTDRLSDLLLTPDEMSSNNLRAEGAEEKRIRMVGNIMIDTLTKHRNIAEVLEVDQIIMANKFEDTAYAHIGENGFAMVTLHRPSNVDQEEVLRALVEFFISEVAVQMPLIWSIHPRTHKQLEHFGLLPLLKAQNNITLLQPLGYHEMLKMNMQSRIMLTDSGGLQEECTVLGTPCLTMRWNTERPVTLTEHGGASVLVGNNVERIKAEYYNALTSTTKPQSPPLWDGQTAERCLNAIINY